MMMQAVKPMRHCGMSMSQRVLSKSEPNAKIQTAATATCQEEIELCPSVLANSRCMAEPPIRMALRATVLHTALPLASLSDLSHRLKSAQSVREPSSSEKQSLTHSRFQKAR
jgi:hypothetical protein